MTAPVKALFAPFRLGSLELPTRVVMAPMTRSFSPGGVPNAQVVEYYRRRAAGGVGLIITEGTTVGHKAANGYPHVPRFYGEDALAGWKQVVDAVHAEGGKIVPQLWHVGNVRKLGTEPDASVPGYGPMEKVKDGQVVVHGMTQAYIDEVIAAFAQAARDAKAIGMDGVEIHGAHGYLIDQFFWEGSNQRTDQYGGDLAARSRFAIELIQADMLPIALVVFVASILVPTFKLVGIALLLYSVQRHQPMSARQRILMYRFIEWIGRWSMLDIFVIAILVALVNFGNLATISADLGAAAFATVVILTMLAAVTFDPRLIWDNTDTEQEEAASPQASEG
jgi:hypothetical protein